MYGDIRVARISVDLSGRISFIIRIESADYMPPGTMAIGQETTMWLRSWWNEGRQFGNFEILRGPESLRPIGFAPIFDTGSSMGFDQPTVWIRGKRPWMSARRDHPRDKIGLIPSFDRLDSDSLNGFGEEVIDLLDVEGSIIDSDCVAAVAEYLERGVSGLPAFIDFDVPPSDDPRLTSFSEPTDVDQ